VRQTFDTSLPLPLRTELERSSILKKIEDNADAKLIALFAPSGFGKTTLMAKVARASLKCVIWLSLSDQILTSQFCKDLIHEIRAQDPNCQLSYVEHALQQETNGVGTARALAQDLNLSDQNFVFFFDRIDILDATGCRWLETFIASLGEGHQIFLGGYGSLPLKLTQFVSQGSALIFGRDQLAFSSEETEVYLKARGYNGNILWTHEQLDGWPAGVAFVASGANPTLHPADLVLDALEVLPTEIRATLCEMSVLETWSEDLSLAMGVSLPRGWLQTVRRTGLPISPLAHGVVRPHRLMLEVLEQELRLEPERAKFIYAKAAELAVQNQESIRAVTYFLRASRFDDAIQIATEAVRESIAKWEPKKVRTLLEVLPIELLTPQLEAALGQALLDTGDSDRGESLFHNVIAAGNPDPMTFYGLALIAARRGKHDLQIEWLEKALTLPTSAAQIRKILRLKASAFAGLGRLEEALQLTLECIAKAELAGDLSETASALDVAEYVYGLLGRHLERERVIERALELFKALDMPLRAIALKSSLAEVCHNTGRSEEAETHINTALLLAEREDHPLLVKLLEIRGDHQFSQLKFSNAANDYEAAFAACQRFGRESIAVRLLLKSSDVLRQLGESAKAETMNERALSYGIPESSARLYVQYLFATGQSLFESQQFDAAKDCFQRALTLNAESDLQVRSELFLIELQLRQGSLSPEENRVLESKHKSSKSYLFQLDSRLLTNLQTHFVAQGKPQISYPVVLNTNPPFKPQKTRLEITTLGRFEVKIDGQSVGIPITKSVEVLVWLALHGRSRRETIIDAIWDGSNERRHAEYFRFAIRRLRSSLSEHGAVIFNPIPFEVEYYQISDQFEIDLDVIILGDRSEQEDAKRLERCLEQLKGTFMPTIESEWAQIWRDRYETQATTIALDLAEHYATELPGQALKIYERLIELNPLHEEAHTAMIQTYQTLGEHHTANRFLNVYEKILREEMDMDLPKHLSALRQIT
jgi:LuxR family transcriptional regulator, maltose regulon positive regulatory protein